MNLNQVTLAGRMTRDAEVKFTPKGMAIGNFGLVINKKFKSGDEMKEEVTFIDVTAFGKTAEAIGQYCRKGSTILVMGSLKTETWDDKNTKEKRSKLVVICDRVEFAPRSGGDSQQQQSRPTQATAGAKDAQEVESDSVPF